MSNRPTTTPNAPSARPAPANASTQCLEQLTGVMSGLLAEHERMLALTVEHRRAISEADMGALRACLTQQGEVAGAIAALEKQRLALVGTITGQRGTITGVPAHPNAPRTTITQLAGRAPEPVRSRLLGVTDALRELLNTLHREHLALRTAAETLSSHMEGVMRQVCRTLSHAGTYARSGSVDASVQVVSALDVRT